MKRALFVCDGPSDLALGDVLRRLCAHLGYPVVVSAPDLRELPIAPPAQDVASKVSHLLRFDSRYDVVFVHRDAERASHAARVSEIHDALEHLELPHVPVVPVRMTEAWLLVDEQAIREVAGRSATGESLGLPPLRSIERKADPKSDLQDVLLAAGNPQGRRRTATFQRRFSDHRRQLLDRLDVTGPIRELSSWQRLEESLHAVMAS